MIEVLPGYTKCTCSTKQTEQNLTDIDTRENIRLIQACTYHDYYKISSKEYWIMAINHNLLP